MNKLNKILFTFILIPALVIAKNQCEENFSKTGSIFTGKAYKTTETLKKINYNYAFEKIYLYLTKDGWNIINSNKNAGTINASQEVSFGNGKISPLNVIVEKTNFSDTKVSIVYNMSAGVTTSKKRAKKFFCKIINSAL